MTLEFVVDDTALKKLVADFPELIDKASYNTAVWGQQLIMRKTPSRSGAAKASWTVVKVPQGYSIRSVIGRGAAYTPYLEHGTGLFGPYNRKIVPKNANALAIPTPGGLIFRKSSKGMEAVRMVSTSEKPIADQFPKEVEAIFKTMGIT